MELKILHSADWHLGAAASSLEEGPRQLLRSVMLRLPALMAELCRQEQCDLVLLSGDLLEGRASRELLDALKQGLGECAVPVFIAPGNHDYIGSGAPWLEEDWPENVHIFTGGLESVALPELDARIWGAGYRQMDCPALLEDFRAEGEERWKVGILHGDPARPDSPYCPVTVAQAEASELDLLALGHVHKAGAFRAGRTLCAWPGCPQGQGWDETGEKGAYIITLGEETRLRWAPFTGPRFHALELDIGSDPLAALKQVLPGAASTDFFRITLTGTGEPDLPALKRAFPEIPFLWLRDRTMPPVELWAGAGEDTLEGVFFGILRDAAMEAEDKEREHIVLAAKLARQLLEGREVKLP